MTRRLRTPLVVACLVGSLLFGLAVHLSNPVLPEDDAYITYRYADNLLNGKGLVYNPGQKVFGSSTPLYVVWLAGIHSVARSVPTPDLAVHANYIFYALTVLGIFFLLTRLGCSSALAALLAGLLAMRQSLLKSSLGGMETYLFAGLLVWSLWAIMARRFQLGAWLAGLSVLARPEGVLMVVLFFTSGLVERRDWRELVGLFAPGLAWVAFATPYFGTPLYHSILAKSRPLYPLPAGSALAALATWLVLWMVGGSTLWPAGAMTAYILLLTLVLVATAFGYVQRIRPRISAGAGPYGRLDSSSKVREFPVSLGRIRGRQARETLDYALMVPGLLALFVLFYAVSNPLLFSWYLPPVYCLWFLGLTSGVVFAAEWLRVRGRRLVAAALFVGLLILVAGPTLQPLRARASAHRRVTDLKLESGRDIARTIVYREVAEWLNQVVPPGDTLVSPEIGALGYYYHGPVIDACGLVSPEALPFLPVPAGERIGPDVGAISLELVKHLQCDIVVTIQRLASQSLYPSSWYHQAYELVQQFRLPVQFWGPGGDTIDVFYRRDGRAVQNWRASAVAPHAVPR